MVERRRAVLGAARQRRRRGLVGERRAASGSGAGAGAGLRQLSSSQKKYVHNQFKPDPR